MDKVNYKNFSIFFENYPHTLCKVQNEDFAYIKKLNTVNCMSQFSLETNFKADYISANALKPQNLSRVYCLK